MRYVNLVVPHLLTIVSLEGNTLTLSDPNAVEEIGEIEVSGTLTMVLVRQ